MASVIHIRSSYVLPVSAALWMLEYDVFHRPLSSWWSTSHWSAFRISGSSFGSPMSEIESRAETRLVHQKGNWKWTQLSGCWYELQLSFLKNFDFKRLAALIACSELL